MKRTSIVVGAGIAIAWAGFVAFAGPLDPPVGPIASTAKPIAEVEPRIAINATNTPGTATGLFRITQPGSYYLTGNITGATGKSGIEIAANGVTLDLMGFDLVGVSGATDGVRVALTFLSNISVVNGSVRDWPGSGVNLQTQNCLVSALRVSGCSGAGIQMTGAVGPRVSNCVCFSNNVGIAAGNGAVITGCSAYSNATDGITLSTGGVVRDCTLTDNNGNGVLTLNSCTVEFCDAEFNSLDGIRVGSGSLVLSNNCRSNGVTADGAGIHATGSDNRVEGNNCTTADRGIDVDNAGNVIIRNTCAGNTTDWEIAANNVFGPIIDRRAPASAAVSGFAAASTLGSTDSNANFSY